jgi:uncharacterized protein (TIRG00374 family)
MTVRRAANVLLGLAVSAVCIWLALRGVSLHSVWHEIQQTQLIWLVPAVATLLVAIGIRAERWRLLFPRPQRPSFPATFWALNIGYLFNSILPIRAGELARVLALSRETGLPKTQGLVTVVVERAFDLAALALITLVALPLLPNDGLVHTLALLSVAILVVCGVLVALLAVQRLRGFASRHIARAPVLGRERAERTIRSFAAGVAALRDPSLALPVAGWSLLSWVVLGVSDYFVLRAFDLGVPWEAALLVLITTNLAQAAPSTAAALGVFEIAAQTALRSYGVPKGAGLSFGIVLHATNVLPVVILGVIALVRIGVSGRELLHAPAQEQT